LFFGEGRCIHCKRLCQRHIRAGDVRSMSYPLPSSLLVKENIVAWLSIDIGIRIINAAIIGVCAQVFVENTRDADMYNKCGLIGLGAADLVVSALEIVSSWPPRE
jgi:hypothetical protein